jgi:hypothetical protein
MSTLIVGCSFFSSLTGNNPDQWQLRPDIQVRATSGTGNQAMAARVLYEISQHNYDRVLVCWTGINRLDTVITRQLHETFPGAWEGCPNYSFCTPLSGPVIWYHSGGEAGSWTWDTSCPRPIREIFRHSYIGADSMYYSDISLSSITVCQSVLNHRRISNQMSWIYDPFEDYSNTKFGHALGQINKDSCYFSTVDWSNINTLFTPWEWAQKNPVRFESDLFHPTRDAMREWIKLAFDLDIAV